jgi:hypothetical protein
MVLGVSTTQSTCVGSDCYCRRVLIIVSRRCKCLVTLILQTFIHSQYLPITPPPHSRPTTRAFPATPEYMTTGRSDRNSRHTPVAKLHSMYVRGPTLHCTQNRAGITALLHHLMLIPIVQLDALSHRAALRKCRCLIHPCATRD